MNLQTKAFFAGFQIEKIGVKNGVQFMSKPIQPWETTTAFICFQFQPLIRLGLMLLNGKVLQLIRSRQKGGTKQGLAYLHSFVRSRHNFYQNSISKPELSRKACSRLSPYICLGQPFGSLCMANRRASQAQRCLTISTKCFHLSFAMASPFYSEVRNGRSVWNLKASTKDMPLWKNPANETYIQAWKTGHTGFPLVDASMRCLVQTGYVNFRMRAMLVSFLYPSFMATLATRCQAFGKTIFGF